MSQTATLDSLENEIVSIRDQIIFHYAPKKIILFGSQAKGTASPNSDIDLCVIADTNNKRNLLTDMYLNIESHKPFDLLVYTQEEWEQCVNDASSFAYQLNLKGIVLYG